MTNYSLFCQKDTEQVMRLCKRTEPLMSGSASIDFHFVRWTKYKNTNTKYTCDTGQTRNKLLEQWVHLTNHTAGHSRPGTTHLAA